MKARLLLTLATILLSVGAIAQSFDHEVTQPAPGGNTPDGGPQAASNITSVAGVPLVRLNNGVMMPRFGLGTQVQSLEGPGQRWPRITSGRTIYHQWQKASDYEIMSRTSTTAKSEFLATCFSSG